MTTAKPVTPPFKRPDIKRLQHWVYEAHAASEDERAERWTDAKLVDGDQWSDTDWRTAQDAGVMPITVNHIFPIVNLLRGHQIINRVNITAKGATQKDSELSEIMTEALKFLMHQNEGDYILSEAFADQVGPGWGCCFLGTSWDDPRREPVRIEYRDWKNIFWDPFGSPFLDTRTCRYVFEHKWMDLDSLKALFPDKAAEIDNRYEAMSSDSAGALTDFSEDEATEVEDERRMSSTYWVQSDRKRVRPVEMWYVVYEPATFAVFADGRVMELDLKKGNPLEIIQAVKAAQRLPRAVVRKLRVCTFLGDTVLQDVPSPCPHDQYPFVPFVGYVDRLGFPYGMPRQVRGQQEEVNRRRSMMLAHLQKRRIIVDKEAVEDTQAAYEEANKLDGMIVLKDGGKRFEMDEQMGLSEGQFKIMQVSSAEIQQISGANDERLGQESRAMSGAAMDSRVRRSETLTASLFDNYRRACHRLGELAVSEVQGTWTYEKVLRITDSLTKADRFVTLNEKIKVGEGVFEVRNNVTQGKYDVVVSDAPRTDTIREQNANLLMETIKKSPPEVIPQLMLLWFEISNLPNKDAIMAKIRPMFGEAPDAQDMSPEEIKAKAMAEIQQQQAKAQDIDTHEHAMRALDVAKLQAEIAEIISRAEKNKSDAAAKPVEAGAKATDADTRRETAKVAAFKTGAEVGSKCQPQPTPQSMTPPAEVSEDRDWRRMYL
ncbi:MAG: hypothetical protein KKE73_10895 [Proteobacteria bacterium]|nr:hypothetical protein [Pseudomonadota bacterium]